MRSVNRFKAGPEAWRGHFAAAAALPTPPAPRAVDVERSSIPAEAPAPKSEPPLRLIYRSTPKRRPAGNIDLKLLSIINELHRTRSVSLAAENLQLSQSTISMSLAKLRRQFQDPLFVRTSMGMEPTPHALEVLALLKKAEGLIQSALEHQVRFEPATSSRIFRVCSTDIAQLTLIPPLMRKLERMAPLVQVELVNLSDSILQRLESGEADLAVGYIPPMGAGFYQQRLFRDRFMCAVRMGHPRIDRELTLEMFQRENHLTVGTSGTGYAVIERTLEARKIQRKIGLRVPSFLGLGPILMGTDLVAIVPEHLGKYFAASGKIKLLPLPFAIPPYYILQHWHERYNQDPANIWFRGLIAELFLP
ncbi:MAG TPA: LysR family transcriptional regulator [Bryobacteraceae bacterium]